MSITCIKITESELLVNDENFLDNKYEDNIDIYLIIKFLKKYGKSWALLQSAH